MHAIPIAFLPFLTVIVFQVIPLSRHHLIGTEHIPVLVEVFFRHFPKQIGVTDGGKNVVCLHPVIAIVGAKL